MNLPTKRTGLCRGYTLRKNDFIEGIIKETGFNGLQFMICTHDSEWKAAKRFRQKYFFTPSDIDDPYTWTFEHKDHKHLVLYQGVKIVGYAHIQFWPDHRAAIRIIVVDEEMRNQSLGRQFMQLIEKWIKLEGYKSVHTESSPQALNFYTKRGYVPMPFNDPDGYEGGAGDIEVGKIL